MEQFNFSFCDEYSHSIEFKTSIVKRFDLSEQRQALWLNPKRTFKLDFELKPTEKQALDDFFRAKKGDFSPFFWHWSMADYGLGLDYKCFLDDSSMNRTIYPQDYAKTSLSLATIEDRNVLRNRYFLRDEAWDFVGNLAYDGAKINYSGPCTLSQVGVLTPGEVYMLKTKITDSQGVGPVLSISTAGLGASDRQIYEGETNITFIAQSPDLLLEMPAGSIGSFLEIAALKIAPERPVFDFEHNIEHQSEMRFSNLKDEVFTFAQTRQNLCENPLRRWVLVLELTPSRALEFEEFFIAQMGSYRAFSWNYKGEDIKVRFDTDKLDQKQYALGYREVKIPIIEVLQ